MVERRECTVHKIFFVILATLISSSYCLKGGLIAGELKRLRPTVIKNFSQISPVYINFKSEDKTLAREFFNTLHAKPPMKRCIDKPPPSKKYQRSIFSVPKLPFVSNLLPLIPKSPILPLMPSWFPPPPPSPVSPPLTTLPNLFKLDTNESGILEKLIKLKQQGLLTTEEYVKFKYLLLKK